LVFKLMLKISVKQSRAVCSKRIMAPVALDVGDAAALALVAPDKVAPDKVAPDKVAPDKVDALASVDPDKVDPDKVDLDKVGPVLAGEVRAIVEVQQVVVVA
jgi:hypothetical protein